MSGVVHSRALSGHELARCRRVAREVAALEDAGSVGWVSADGRTQVFGGISRIEPREVDEAFFNELRRHAFIFSGDRVAGEGEPARSWTDPLARIFDPAGAAADWCIPAWRRYTRGVPAEDLFSPPLIMGEAGWRVDGYVVNRDVVAYQERINVMRELGVLDRLRPDALIVEIGGGYGALARHLKQARSGATYLIIDLPRSLLFSGCYLAAALPEAEIAVFRPPAAIAPGSVTLVSNADLGRLPPLEIDAALNTLSFAEMPDETVRGYCAWLERNLAPHGVLFEQNFDNRNLGYTHFSCPEEVIARHFARRDSRSRDLHWGRANLWGRKTAARRLLDRLIA